MDLSLIIPARNEALRLGPTLVAFHEALKDRFHASFEIIVVVNNCTDRTFELVEALQANRPEIGAIQVGDVGGKGGAVREGVYHAKGTLIGFVDADGSVMPDQFCLLVDAMDAFDAAIASRRLPESEIVPHRRLDRACASMAFSVLVRSISAIPFKDSQCGGKLFRRSALEGILDDCEETGWCFDVEWLALLLANQYRVIEVPVVWYDRKGSNLHLLRDSFGMLRDLFRIRRRMTARSGSALADSHAGQVTQNEVSGQTPSTHSPLRPAE